MTYTTLDGATGADYGYGRDGVYRADGEPRAHQGGSRIPARELRRGDVCPGCGVERSVVGHCTCNT